MAGGILSTTFSWCVEGVLWPTACSPVSLWSFPVQRPCSEVEIEEVRLEGTKCGALGVSRCLKRKNKFLNYQLGGMSVLEPFGRPRTCFNGFSRSQHSALSPKRPDHSHLTQLSLSRSGPFAVKSAQHFFCGMCAAISRCKSERSEWFSKSMGQCLDLVWFPVTVSGARCPGHLLGSWWKQIWRISWPTAKRIFTNWWHEFSTHRYGKWKKMDGGNV